MALTIGRLFTDNQMYLEILLSILIYLNLEELFRLDESDAEGVSRLIELESFWQDYDRYRPLPVTAAEIREQYQSGRVLPVAFHHQFLRRELAENDYPRLVVTYNANYIVHKEPISCAMAAVTPGERHLLLSTAFELPYFFQRRRVLQIYHLHWIFSIPAGKIHGQIVSWNHEGLISILQEFLLSRGFHLQIEGSSMNSKRYGGGERQVNTECTHYLTEASAEQTYRHFMAVIAGTEVHRNFLDLVNTHCW